MTLQRIPSEFPFIWRKFYFIFISVPSKKIFYCWQMKDRQGIRGWKIVLYIFHGKKPWPKRKKYVQRHARNIHNLSPVFSVFWFSKCSIFFWTARGGSVGPLSFFHGQKNGTALPHTPKMQTVQSSMGSASACFKVQGSSPYLMQLEIPGS